MRIMYVCAILALACAAATASPEDAARASLNAYRMGGAPGAVALENECWRRAASSRAKDDTIRCLHHVFAGILIDQVQQRVERRGPLPAFSARLQRERFLDRARTMGMTEAQADVLLNEAGRSLQIIVVALAEAGL